MVKALARFFGGLFILSAAIGAGTIGVAVLSATAATPITVNDASDPTTTLPPGNCTMNPEGDCTLRAALEEAQNLNAAVTIVLPAGTYSVNANVGQLTDKDTGGLVTIEGAGASRVDISAIGATRLLEIEPGVVADISGVTVSGGNPDPAFEQGDCGGICVSGADSELTLTNSIVSGNTASTYGGGIELYHGGSATLMDDTISGNTVDTAANADGGGGGISVLSNDTSASNLTIQGTTISGNEVDAGSGNGSGAGIDVLNTSGSDPNLTIHIDDSTISGNKITGAGGDGSGIAALDANWLVTNSTISGNTETPGTQVDGGGAFVSNASLDSTWKFDTIAGNTATSANSGGNLDVQSPSTLNLGESIVAGGVSGGSQNNCLVGGGSLHSAGYNLIDDTSCGTPATSDIIGQSPQLGGLAANGGPTPTQVPASTSPAVSAVPAPVTSGTGVNTDQRGDSRGQGVSGTSTIGSVEVAPPAPTTPTTTPTTTPATAPTSTHGYWLVGSDGGIFSFGSAQFYGSTGSITLQRPVVGISPTASNNGYWLVASDGGIFAFGNAGYYGSIPGVGLAPAGSGLPHRLNAPIVGIVPSSDGGGYFMVASDGGVFGFGDARFAGSCPGIGGCAGAAAAVVPDASGNGYWLITQTGNVYAFGDAPYYGAPGNQGAPVTSAVRTADGGGYWVLLANGAVDAYGDAVARGGPVGSIGALNEASAIFSDADGGGYWVAAADGAVYCYGNAPNEGSMAGRPHNGSIIAATGF